MRKIKHEHLISHACRIFVFRCALFARLQKYQKNNHPFLNQQTCWNYLQCLNIINIIYVLGAFSNSLIISTELKLKVRFSEYYWCWTHSID